MRNLVIALVLFLGFFFVFSRFVEVQDVVNTLRQADWGWLALAFLVQVTWMFNLGGMIRLLYHLLGMRERVHRLAILAAAANFVNVVAPSMGMGAIAIFIMDGRRRRLPAGRITTGATLYVLYDYLALLALVTAGLVLLYQRNELQAGEIIASLILLAVAVGLATLCYLGMRSATKLGNALAWMANLVNRILRPFIHRDYVQLSRAHDFATDVVEGLHQARRSRHGLLGPMAFALVGKLLLIGVLALVFLALGKPFSAATLIVGVSIANMFLIVSITPSGVGFVEGAMTLALHSMRVPLTDAALITLAYRGVTFWWLLAYGALAFRWVTRGPRPHRTLANGIAAAEASERSVASGTDDENAHKPDA